MKPAYLLVLPAVIALTSCSDKPATPPPTAEVRGTPIELVAAKPAEPLATAKAIEQPVIPPTSTTAVASASSAAVPPSAHVAAPVLAPASEPARVVKTAAPAAAPAKAPEFLTAGFEILSGYNIEVSDELLGPVTNNVAEITAKTEALIPEKVRALNQKKVALKGFMLPLKVEGGLVTEMLVMKDQSMCCFGTVPKIHEWVSVKMSEKGVKPLMDQAVTLMGRLHVGEMRENGYLTGIYRMDGEKMAAEGN